MKRQPTSAYGLQAKKTGRPLKYGGRAVKLQAQVPEELHRELSDHIARRCHEWAIERLKRG